jgi:hypothetical protein
MKKTKVHRGVGVVYVTDPMLLTEMENDSALQPFLGERLGELSIAVQSQAIPDVVRRLRAMGHMPRVLEPASSN